MVMKIYTLGTGHGDSTFCRMNSSIVYETEDGSLYLVDAGAPVEALLRRKGLQIDRLRAVFITHMHDDHAGGLTGLLKQVVKYPGERVYPLTLYLPEKRSIGALQNWLLALHEETALTEPVKYLTVEDGEIYSDENLVVNAFRTRHLFTEGRTKGTPCSFAYELDFKQQIICRTDAPYLEKRDYRVLHTGDLAADFSDFPEVSYKKHFDICLCEATHYEQGNASEKMRKADFGRLLFIHIGDQWHTHVLNGWQICDGEKKLLGYFKGFPYPVQIAHDGDEFVL